MDGGKFRCRATLVGVIVLSVALASCSSGPQGRVHHPQYGPLTQDAAALARETRLGPDGFGKIKLRMTISQTVDTGQFILEKGSGTAYCQFGYITGSGSFGGSILISPTFGVAEIEDYPGVHTPEGIGAGSSFDKVKEVYPNLHEETAHYPAERYEDMTTRYITSVPGNPLAQYLFYFSDDTVESMALVLAQQNCDPWPGPEYK